MSIYFKNTLKIIHILYPKAGPSCRIELVAKTLSITISVYVPYIDHGSVITHRIEIF